MSPLPNKSLPDPAIQRNFLELDKRLSIQGLLGGGASAFPGALGAGIPVLYTATATTSGPTTTSTANPPTVVLSEMSITADFGGDPIVVFFNGAFSNSTAAAVIRVQINDGGSPIATTLREVNIPNIAGARTSIPIVHAFTPASQTIDVRWGVNAGTGTALTVQRSLVIARLKQ